MSLGWFPGYPYSVNLVGSNAVEIFVGPTLQKYTKERRGLVLIVLKGCDTPIPNKNAHAVT
jgi:hypothetical protein